MNALFLGAALFFFCAGTAFSDEATLNGVVDLEGNSIQSLPTDKNPLVLVFMSVECPIANRYAPALQRLIETNTAARFVLVYPHTDEDVIGIKRHLKAYRLSSQAWHDPARSLTKFVEATITPEAVVFHRGKIVYRGRIDDQYSDWGKQRLAPTKHDLQEVLDEIAAGKEVEKRVTQAVGCYISSVDE